MIENAHLRSLRGSYLQSLVEQYNKYWSHDGLIEITKKHMTPDEDWTSMIRHNR